MTFEEHYEIGEEYFSIGEYDKALKHFKEAININNYYNCMNYSGLCYLNLKEYELAIRTFKIIVDDVTDIATPVINLGRAYLNQGLFAEAFENFNKAININPHSEDAHFYLGVFFGKIRIYEEARKCYEKSLSINVEQAETHLNLGICYYNLQSYDKALSEFDLAFKYDNLYLEAKENKGLIYVEMGDYSKALEEFLFVNKIEPECSSNIVDIAHCYCQCNDFENAFKWIKKAVILNPNDEFVDSMLKMVSSKLQKE